MHIKKGEGHSSLYITIVINTFLFSCLRLLCLKSGRRFFYAISRAQIYNTLTTAPIARCGISRKKVGALRQVEDLFLCTLILFLKILSCLLFPHLFAIDPRCALEGTTAHQNKDLANLVFFVHICISFVRR